MSPVMQQRLARFKQNRLGFICLIVFAVIFVLAIFSELIANDKPLVVKYQQSYYFPVIQSYPETTFGGIFETETDYKDPAVQQLIDRDGWALWPVIPFSYQTPNLELAVPVPSPPSQQNWLGTDDQGRDVLARILYGLRVSLLFGFALTLCAAFIGILIGALQGYYGGWVDLIGQRVLEVWGGLPMLFMVMILVSMFTPSVYWLFVIMLLFGWTALVGLVRAEFLRARNFDYVRAARALGVADRTIIFRHILPNAISSSLSQLPFMLTANITALTALDFWAMVCLQMLHRWENCCYKGKIISMHRGWRSLAFTLALVLSLLIYVGGHA